MFLGMQGTYVAIVSESKEKIEALKDVIGLSSIEETNELIQEIDGKYIVGVENIKNEAKNKRAQLYLTDVDPITAHIQRLKDQDPIPEGEIAELIAEREAKVQEIKARYPYSEVKDVI